MNLYRSVSVKIFPTIGRVSATPSITMGSSFTIGLRISPNGIGTICEHVGSRWQPKNSWAKSTGPEANQFIISTSRGLPPVVGIWVVGVDSAVGVDCAVAGVAVNMKGVGVLVAVAVAVAAAVAVAVAVAEAVAVDVGGGVSSSQLPSSLSSGLQP